MIFWSRYEREKKRSLKVCLKEKEMGRRKEEQESKIEKRVRKRVHLKIEEYCIFRPKTISPVTKVVFWTKVGFR